MRKLFLITLPLLLAIYVACIIYEYWFPYGAYYETAYRISYTAWATLVFLLLGRLFAKGTFRRSRQVRLAYLGIALLCLYMVFKIQHWSMMGLLLLIAAGTTAIAYTIHFFRKRYKRALDVIKLVYLLLLLTSISARQMHFSLSVELSWAVTIVFLALLVLSYIEEWKGVPEAKAGIATEGSAIFLYSDEEESSPEDLSP